MDPKTLLYFQIHGKAEAMRSLLKYTNQEFTDKAITFDEWPVIKEAGEIPLPGGQIPVFTSPEGQTLNQQGAIMRAIGRKTGHYPQDNDQESFLIDWSMDTYQDLWSTRHYLKFMSDAEPTEEDIAKFVADVEKNVKQFEEKLTKLQLTYLAGQRLTIADFTVFSLYSSWVYNDHTSKPTLTAAAKTMIENYPAFKAWIDRMTTDLADHLATRGQYTI